MPEEIINIFQKAGDKLPKFYRMLGSQTYYLRRNLQIGVEAREIALELANRKRKILEKSISPPIDFLSAAIGLSLGLYRCQVHDLRNIDFERGPVTDQETLQAINALAKAAYSIREAYPKKGLEVRTGLVHPQSCPKLEKLAAKNADPKIVKLILDRNRAARRSVYSYAGEIISPRKEETFRYWVGYLGNRCSQQFISIDRSPTQKNIMKK